MTGDKIFINAQVLTMDPGCGEANAFAVSGGRFVCVGNKERALDSIGNTNKVDIVSLNGKTVVPGFIETHSHLSLYAMALLQANCRTPPNRNIGDVKRQVRKMIERSEKGEWIRGWGYDDTLIEEKRHLTKHDLDEVAPNNPVFISHTSGHLAYVNSKALEIAGIKVETPQPSGGHIEKDQTGDPTGLLKEDPAINLVLRHIPPYPVSRLKGAMRKGIKYLHRHGITSAHDAAIGYFRNEKPIIQAYCDFEREGELSVRVYLTLIERVYRTLLEAGFKTGFGSEFLKLGAVKFFQDGSIQALTAALEKPYFCKPGHKGELIYNQDDLNRQIELYHKEKIQVAVHANGDRAIESVLKAFREAMKKYPVENPRHMIIHCQLATRKQIMEMKGLGIIPSYFVNHVHFWGDRHKEIFLGPDRASRIDPLATTVNMGLPFTLHSDLPITPVNPLFSIYCAVNRKTSEGDVLGENERITPLEALKAYTTYAALCSFEEKIKGSIEVGKFADFVILSDNPLEVEPERIKDIEVLETYVAGERVF